MKGKMGKTFLAAGIVVLAIVFFSSEALPWGFATHTYIDDHIGKEKGIQNGDELYGSKTPDMFLYLFALPYSGNLSVATHNYFINVWNASRDRVERALAYGFVSHNDIWGADFIAHHSGTTYGQTEGYVIAKAKDLLAMAPLPPELGIPDEAALEIVHELVENGVDILMKRADSMIGQKIISSAILRSPQFPRLLAKAYADDVSALAGISHEKAKRFIFSEESRFRKSIVLYGQVLTLEEAAAIRLLSEQTADIAEDFLALYGIQLPIAKEQVLELVIAYTQLAMSLCEGDYLQEISETVAHVDREMKAHGIVY